MKSWGRQAERLDWAEQATAVGICIIYVKWKGLIQGTLLYDSDTAPTSLHLQVP